jgi:ABC-type transport system involved in multi-copper enzyme maturation permease subunit
MHKILTIARFTFLEAVSNKALHSTLLFVLLLIGASGLYGQVSIADTTHVIKDAGLFGITLFGAITAALAGVSLFNKDIKQRTIHNILSKPVSRSQYIIGKYFGFCLTVWSLQLLMGTMLIAVVACYSGTIETELAVGVYGCMLEAAIISALVILFSSFALTPVLPGLFTVSAFIAGHSLDFISRFGAEHISGTALRIVFSAITGVIPDLALFNWNSAIVYNNVISLHAVGLASGYAVLYATAVLLVSCIIFKRRELN